MISFKQYVQLITEGETSAKTGLYPLGYGGIGNYPPEYMLSQSADAIYYVSADERLQKIWEKGPFKIDHLKPAPALNLKQGKKLYVSPKGNLPPGKIAPPKEPKLENNIKKPKEKKHPCQVDNPVCLPPHLSCKEAERFGNPCPNMFKMPD